MPYEDGDLAPGIRASGPVGRYEDGELEAGDLGGGGYGAFEGDLGEKLRPLAGFGRDLTEIEYEEEEEAFEFVFQPSGFTTKDNVRFILRGWSA